MTDVRHIAVTRSDGTTTDDLVAAEAPLEIRIFGAPWVTVLRTPGNDLDLAVGLLHAEGVIDDVDDLAGLDLVGPPDQTPHAVDTALASGVPRPDGPHRLAASGCGACGVVSIADLARATPLPARASPPDDPCALARALDGAQPLFARTGATHAAALICGDRRWIREDVGRHNAADKAIGACLRGGHLPAGGALVLSSRAGFEIVQKALRARCAVVITVGAPTSLAVEAATWGGLLLYGFVRGDRWVRYA